MGRALVRYGVPACVLAVVSGCQVETKQRPGPDDWELARVQCQRGESLETEIRTCGGYETEHSGVEAASCDAERWQNYQNAWQARITCECIYQTDEQKSCRTGRTVANGDCPDAVRTTETSVHLIHQTKKEALAYCESLIAVDAGRADLVFCETACDELDENDPVEEDELSESVYLACCVAEPDAGDAADAGDS